MNIYVISRREQILVKLIRVSPCQEPTAMTENLLPKSEFLQAAINVNFSCSAFKKGQSARFVDADTLEWTIKNLKLQTLLICSRINFMHNSTKTILKSFYSNFTHSSGLRPTGHLPVSRNVNDGCTLSAVFRTFLHKTNGSSIKRDETQMSLPSRCSFLMQMHF